MTGFIGLLLGSEPANAQVEPITASQVMDKEDLKQFVLYAAQVAETVTSADDVPAWIHQIEQDGDWKHDDVFLIVLLPGGTVFRHTNDSSLNFQNINDVEDARGNKVVQALMAAGAMDGGGFVEYYLDGDPVLAEDSDSTKTAYAVNYTSGVTNGTVTIVSGFYQDISGTGDVTPTLDPELLKPEVTAAEVMDRESLKQFVNGSIASLLVALEQIGIDELVKNHDIFHEEGGYWRQGNTYLFALTTEGIWFLHGANKAKENTNAWDDTDVNGVKFIQELISAAKHEDGGFVQYHYDDPDVMGDEDTGSPKLSYARTLTFHGNEYVVGSGLYFELADHVGTIELAVDPDVLTEGETQTVTVTATQTRAEGALPVSVRMPLSLSGTAVEDTDYTVTGDRVVTIPAEMTEGSTELTFTADGDDLHEPYGETIIVTASHDMEEVASVTIRLTDETMPVTASQVTDRETLADFVETARARIVAINKSGEPQAPFYNSLTKEGDWKHENIFLIILNEEGIVLLHGDDQNAGGKNLYNLVDSRGNTVVQDLIAAAGMGGGHVDYYWDDPNQEGDEDTAKFAYATSFVGRAYGNTNILIGGYYQDVSHIDPPGHDDSLVGHPDVTAADVMDRESLKKFVIGAARGFGAALREHGTDRYADILNVFRAEDGDWRHGHTYLFIYNTGGDVVFHAADRTLETRNVIDAVDVNGVNYVELLIEMAQAGGGFVEYHFDDPDIMGDEETGSPIVGYAQLFRSRTGRDLVFGAGLFFDLADHVGTIELSVNPATLTEGDRRTVTVTATQTGAALPVSTILPISLSGTATVNTDYSVTGDMVVTIPYEATMGSTELTFTIVEDSEVETDETIVITATHDLENVASASITVKEGIRAPQVTGTIPDVTLEAGDSETANLESIFTGTALSYSAASSDDGVAEAAMTAATLTVTGVRKGSATVTVTASNAAGTATLEVGVTVTAIAAERMAYENILSAMGRNMLSSVSTTIGGRFAASGGGRGIAVGGRRVDGLASGISALANLTGHRRQAAAKHLALLQDTEYRRTVSSSYLLQSSYFSYALEDHASTGGVRWSVWGAGDLQNFQGEPEVDASYDGSLKTAYLGFDVATQQSWMVGIALSHAIGQSDYDVAVASGSLESTLTSVLPYMRWKCSTGFTEAWSIVGLGTGEVEVEDATSDLSMRMAMVGMRTRLAGTGGVGLDVVGDAGLTRLSTSDSESAALSDINADARRVRIGLEGSRSAKLAGGTTITPYAQLSGRYDGGTGQTGQGLEVSGGLRLSGGRVAVNAQGRFLAVHTADGYSENGFSLVASLSPGTGGTGLSMSVAPRIGAGTGDSGMMWRESPLAGSSVNGRNNARALRAEVGYGLAYPSIGMLMTPFGEVYLLGDDRRQMRLGTRFGTAGSTTGGASMELSGMRVDRHGGASDHRIGLLVRMSF